jgi:glycosyltransferase involved in cell wall biosynthesis
MVLPAAPLITVAVPSFNQGLYLADALELIFDQGFKSRRTKQQA